MNIIRENNIIWINYTLSYSGHNTEFSSYCIRVVVNLDNKIICFENTVACIYIL